MQRSEAYHWLKKGERRKTTLMTLNQPLTAKHVSRRTGLSLEACSSVLWELRNHGLVNCLNPSSRRSRLYWITDYGEKCQDRLCTEEGRPMIQRYFPDIDWNLYGTVCFSHRSMVIKALVEPMQPATTKRKARALNSKLRMSANNVRDVIRLFRRNGIVQQVRFRRKFHSLYELTEIGKIFRVLLVRAEERIAGPVTSSVQII